MLKKIPLIITLLLLFASINSCNDITKSEKFDQKKWKHYGGFDGPDRDLMAEYLIKTHKLIGLTNKQMLQLLGPPANYTDTTKTYYELATEYDVIDPVSGKNLIIQFNKDSLITHAEIQKWHKH
jgi:hypothetical protein